jgi:hypothetical protein
VEPRQLDERVAHRGPRLRVAHQVRQNSRIFVRKRIENRSRERPREIADQRARDVGMSEVEHEIREPRRARRTGGDLHELDVPLRSTDPDELDACLRDLPMLARTFLPAAKHRSLVTEPHRRRSIGEAGRRHACDLGCDVGAECGDFAGLGLDETEDVARIERPQATLEHLRQLERGRRDELVAMEREVIEQPARESAAAGGLRWQKVAHPCGQRVIGHRAGGRGTGAHGGRGWLGRPHGGRRSLAELWALRPIGTRIRPWGGHPKSHSTGCPPA